MAALTVKGKEVGPGSLMTVKGFGERRFKFLYPTWTSAGKLVLNFVGPVVPNPDWPEEYILAQDGCYRSFYPERIKRVLRVVSAQP